MAAAALVAAALWAPIMANVWRVVEHFCRVRT